MQFLVQLSDGSGSSVAPAGRPLAHLDANDLRCDHPSARFPTSDLRETASPTKLTEQLIEFHKHLANYQASGSDEDKEAIIDSMCGRGVVPTYQWYNVGDTIKLDIYEVHELEILFFSRKRDDPRTVVEPLETGAIELHVMYGSIWLRIRRAHQRQMNVEINGATYPLTRIEHYTRSHDYRFDFRSVDRPS